MGQHTALFFLREAPSHFGGVSGGNFGKYNNAMTSGETPQSNLLSSRFYTSVMGFLQFQSLSISLLLKLITAKLKRFLFVFLLYKFRSRVSK